MSLTRRLFALNAYLKRNCSTQSKLAVSMHEEYQNEDDIKKFNKTKLSRTIGLPSDKSEVILRCIKDFPIKTLITDAEHFSRQLVCRQAPMEHADFAIRRNEILDKVSAEYPDLATEIDPDILKLRRNEIQAKTKKILRQRIYSWKSIAYDEYKSLQYLLKRAAPEFATISKIFHEIAQRDTNFKPRSYFDFGSGVGTGVWAASELWKQHFFEYLLVDSSREMNDLACKILQDGDDNKDMNLKNVYFRQFLPVDSPRYDIVLSAYSLFDLPSMEKRHELIHRLWNLCGKYLIFVEYGTNAGFKLIQEARSLLLENSNDINIFSPCPHTMECPKVIANDGTPCNFETKYHPLSFNNRQEVKRELFSYVVFKRTNDLQDNSANWPRLVRPTLVRPRHTICRMCTNDGELKEIIFTSSKQGRPAYRCARTSCWGDLMPIKIDTPK